MGSHPVPRSSPPKTCYKAMELRTAKKILENQEKNQKELSFELITLNHNQDVAIRQMQRDRLLFCRQQTSKLQPRNVSRLSLITLGQKGQNQSRSNVRSSCPDFRSSKQDSRVEKEYQGRHFTPNHVGPLSEIRRSLTEVPMGKANALRWSRDRTSPFSETMTMRSERSERLSNTSSNSVQVNRYKLGFRPSEAQVPEERPLGTISLVSGTGRSTTLLSDRRVPLKLPNEFPEEIKEGEANGGAPTKQCPGVMVSERKHKSLHLTLSYAAVSHSRGHQINFSNKTTVKLSADCRQGEIIDDRKPHRKGDITNSESSFRTKLNFPTPRSVRFNPPPSLRGKNPSAD